MMIALLCSHDSKSLCALFPFVLVGPNLSKMLIVLERYRQTGVVPVIGRFHSGDA